MSDYEDRKQARIDYYREKAGKKREESQQLRMESSKMIEAIPMGQPLLVDHYSYKSDKNYRDRAFNKMGKSFEVEATADYYEQKAEAAESNTAISSDDPQALPKLKEKLAGMEANHADMKAANAHWRKHGTMAGYKDITPEAAVSMDADINNGYSWCRVPYPSFTLTNNNANMKRVKDRIEMLERRQEAGGYVGWDFNGGHVVANAEANRLQIYFDEIPSAEQRQAMKSEGFHYSKYHNHAWQRQLNGNAIYAAGRLDFIAPSDGRKPSELQPKLPPKQKEPAAPERG